MSKDVVHQTHGIKNGAGHIWVKQLATKLAKIAKILGASKVILLKSKMSGGPLDWLALAHEIGGSHANSRRKSKKRRS